MGQKITQVDAFTSERYRGNPAAICILSAEADTEWMQRVANEMNLSETAYILPCSGEFGLRWFTPAVEVDLCGHATVAAAHVLWEENVVPAAAACRFHTRSGVLTARKESGGWIAVEFPRESVVPIAIPADAERALGVKAVAAAESGRLNYLVLELASAADVRNAAPDFTLASKLPHKGLVITSLADAGTGYDVVSRFFAPRMGVNEDPATGSAHCVLGVYWGAKLGRGDMLAYQASARGAVIRVNVAPDRVTLAGQAVTVLRGELV
jgi:PhzF family phenazine biosynthesis protein